MKPHELRAILKSKKPLTVQQVQNIIYELKNDINDKAAANLRKASPKAYECGFYNGETNAFYICLDLLEKVEENEKEPPEFLKKGFNFASQTPAYKPPKMHKVQPPKN